MTLSQQMQDLIQYVNDALAAHPDHHTVCELTANRFDLWEQDRFPIWLSRIVEGQMRDLNIEGD